jgi:TonB-dependent SusC/RagA subfamily outer membrane receptor
MKTNKIPFIFSFILFLNFQMNAQQRNISGKITTFENYPLNKVSVTAKKSGAEAISDSTGYYTITCNKKDKLVFEANGFYNEKVNLKRVETGDSVNVNLKLRNGDKNIELATGYGHIEKDKLTHAIEHASTENDFSNYNSVMEIIDDKFTTIRRGTNSFSNNSILYVVDGTVVQEGIVKNIPTTQVKSINLLKGASASARYGSRGMNGVIVIETKTK